MSPSPNTSFQLDALYRLLIESVRDYAIFALDPSGIIISWNPGAERFKGYTAEEIIGRHFSVFYTQPDIDRNHPANELVIARREGRYAEEGWRVRKDGSHFWASVTITALHDDAGVLVGFAKVTRDLTERRAAEMKAIEDAQRVAIAEASSRAKLEFLASLSHELRTPLNAIGGYVELILMGVRGEISEQTRSDLERVQRSQQSLLMLINDLLNYSRIEAGHQEFRIRPIDMETLLEDAAAVVRPQALMKDVAFQTIDCEAGTKAQADEAKVGQILRNLLSNAIRHTHPGGSVSLQCRSDAGRVIVDVADTGSGIPVDKLESIFEPFVQLGRSLTSSHEGTGLGLSISRELARGMSGDITVSSEEGSGSVFTLTLPSDQAAS